MSLENEPFLGSIGPILESIHREQGFPLEYANHKGSVTAWKDKARDEIWTSLSFSPKSVSLDLQTHEVVACDGYERRKISFASCSHYRVPAYLLVPTVGQPPFPGIIALHDHGGYFYHGKEKLVSVKPEHSALKEFKKKSYGGRSCADELAKRGFVVLVTDAFFWGERKPYYRKTPKDLADQLAALRSEQPEFIQVWNSYLGQCVMTLNTFLSFCGISWLGIVVHDDVKSIDLLQSLLEVNPERIGCFGLSGGGYRSAYLTGLDLRIKASVITGWMTSLPTTVRIPYRVHAGLFDAFGVHSYLDHPDIASLAAPDCALLVQNCAQDMLFTYEGMQSASEKIGRVYADQGAADRYRWRFYDVPHQFNVEMQEEAFAWLEKWLKR